MDISYLGFKKAFDRLSHQELYGNWNIRRIFMRLIANRNNVKIAGSKTSYMKCHVTDGLLWINPMY